MQLGMIGLGRMGGNMVVRLMKAGHDCLVYDSHQEAVDALVGKGAKAPPACRVREEARQAPAGVADGAAAVVDTVLGSLVPLLETGDIIVDGGIPTTTTTSAGPGNCARRVCTMSMSASAAASGVWSAATAI